MPDEPVKAAESTPAADTTSKPVESSGVTHDGTPVGVTAPSGTAPAAEPVKAAATWRDSLPDDLKTEKTFETIKDVPTLAKSYLEMRKMQGASFKRPDAAAPKEEWDSFYEKLGWEKDVEKVTAAVKGPILPAGMEMKQEEVGGFTKHAHGLRMNAEQIQGVLNYYGEFVKQVVPDYKGDSEKAVGALKEEWGLAMDRNMGVARRALLVDFPKETVERIERAGLANDVGFIKSMYERGKGLIEQNIIPEEVGQGMDGKAAQTKVNEMEGDPKSPLWDKSHPSHQEFVEKRNALYKVIYG